MLVSIQKSTGIILRETSRPSVLLIGRFRNCSIHHPLNLLLTNVKDKDKPKDRQGAVYKIKCCDCQATYIGETLARGWLNTNERREMMTLTITLLNTIYRRNIKSTQDSATCIKYSTDYYQRLTLESWFTNFEQFTPLNRSQQLPALYKRLIDEIKQN